MQVFTIHKDRSGESAWSAHCPAVTPRIAEEEMNAQITQLEHELTAR